MAAIDYKQNIDRIEHLTEEEKNFLYDYYYIADKHLPRLYKPLTPLYQKWGRWLKKNSFLIYKIEHYNELALIRNSAEAFDFVLNECVDMVFNAKKKNNDKARLQALNLISKICGLEQYAAASVQKLEENKRQSEIKQLTTEQLKQLAAAVSENVKRINSDTGAAAEDVEVLPGDN